MKEYEDWVFQEIRNCDVILSCTKEFIDESNVEFINIQEDIQGKDILTFKCPKCNKQHESLRFN